MSIRITEKFEIGNKSRKLFDPLQSNPNYKRNKGRPLKTETRTSDLRNRSFVKKFFLSLFNLFVLFFCDLLLKLKDTKTFYYESKFVSEKKETSTVYFVVIKINTSINCGSLQLETLCL